MVLCHDLLDLHFVIFAHKSQNVLCNSLKVSIAQKCPNIAISKSVVGELFTIVVDLQNGIEMGEILKFKMYYFEWKCQPMQTYSERGNIIFCYLAEAKMIV